MSDPFIAEIRIFAGNFAPRGWSFCNGNLLPISQNTALFSLIGTIYGGDGRTTTALPNLEGRIPMHPGRGPGLTPRSLGQRGGANTATLGKSQMPSHTHLIQATADAATTNDPAGNMLANTVDESVNLYHPSPPTAALLNQNATPGNVGGGGAHNNIQPTLGLYFIIALTGTYPSRS